VEAQEKNTKGAEMPPPVKPMFTPDEVLRALFYFLLMLSLAGVVAGVVIMVSS
jgi:hypothetical protein